MARLVYSARAFDDLERLADFLYEAGAEQAHQIMTHVLEALSVLDHHPRIGRRLSGTPFRELVISKGKTGYVALYEYRHRDDLILVLTIRHQREAGYWDVDGDL